MSQPDQEARSAATAPFPTNEELRILVAIRDGTLKSNNAGRYVIEGQARPDRKAREKLTKRSLIENRYQMGLGHHWLLTEKGRSVLREVGFDAEARSAATTSAREFLLALARTLPEIGRRVEENYPATAMQLHVLGEQAEKEAESHA